MKSLLFMLLLLPALAQTPRLPTQSCPITIERWSDGYNGDGVDISYMNNTDKKIDAYKFHIEYVDDFGKPTINTGYDTFEHEHMGNPAKPGKKALAVFKTVNVQKHGWVAVQAVRFKDGSVWEDDGSLSCRGIDYYRWKEQHKKGKN